MINSFKIINKDNTFYPQLAKLNLPNIEFKTGTNVLIGKNGSGKTTIINALAQHTFCNKLGYSMFPKDLIELLNLYTDNSDINSIEIKGDYTESTFKLIIDNEIKSHEIMDNMSNVLRMMGTKNLSTGQKIKYSIEQLLKTMFKEDHTAFDWTYLDKYLDNHKTVDKSDIWYHRCKAIKDYTKTNHITDEHGYFTVLMDEPDRNLDINGLTDVFEILNMNRKDVQVITAIHNPLLICKLAKNKNINFIELTPNYLNTILNFNK